MKTRRVTPWLTSFVLITAAACGPEIATTGATASSNASSGQDSDGTEMSEQDQTAWLVIFVLLGVTTVGFLVAATVSGEEISYLDAHRQDIRVALARGDGPFVRDLGAGLRLPPELVPALGEALRAHRTRIAATLEGPGSVAPARFARAVDLAIRSDARLAPYSRDVLLRLWAADRVSAAAVARYEGAMTRELAATAAR